MASRIAGATTIVAIDVHDSRLELAKELGATHTINAQTANTLEELKRITEDVGVNYILDIRRPCRRCSRISPSH